LVFAVNYSANAQETRDVVFISLGYIPMSVTTFDKNYKYDSTTEIATIDDLESKGVALRGEYNLNLGSLWLGFGLEYQRLYSEWGMSYPTGSPDTFSKHVNQFITPMVTAKLVTAGGFYIGAGVSGKYMISSEKFHAIGGTSDIEWKKKFDLWGNAVVGFFMPISDGVYLDFEGRFGYNLTNNQFTKLTGDGTTYEFSPKSAYDLAIYVGVGFRAFQTGI
jgi:hypothetical protein